MSGAILLAACLTFTQVADQALTEAITLTNSDNEYGGMLWALPNGCYEFTPPQTTGSSQSVTLTFIPPRGARLAGIYHTHPSAIGFGYDFSPQDIKETRRLGVPNFLAVKDPRTHEVLRRVLFPGKRDSRQCGRTMACVSHLQED